MYLIFTFNAQTREWYALRVYGAMERAAACDFASRMIELNPDRFFMAAHMGAVA